MWKLITFIFLIFIYWFAEGATEGYTWADSTERLENVIIKGGSEGNGILDYHSWRFLEILGTHGAILIAILFGLSHSSFIYTGIGSMLVGMFTYERVLNYVNTGTMFKPPGWIFYIGGLELPRFFWQDLILLFVGLGLITLGFYNYLKEEK